jgi:hypothetical protein
MVENTEVTVELAYTQESLRQAVLSRFPGVSAFEHVPDSVFGSQTFAPGNNNSDSVNGCSFNFLKTFGCMDYTDLASNTQIPAQIIEDNGPLMGAVILSEAQFKHTSKVEGVDLWERAKASIIYQNVEKYGFKMGVGEKAATEAVEKVFDFEEKERTLSEVVNDEQDKVDVRFKNGATMQVKTDVSSGVNKQGCDIGCHVDTSRAGEGEAVVTIER